MSLAVKVLKGLEYPIKKVLVDKKSNIEDLLGILQPQSEIAEGSVLRGIATREGGLAEIFKAKLQKYVQVIPLNTKSHRTK